MFSTWIGSNYKSTRLLILGESAYEWKTGDGKIHTPKRNHSQLVAKGAISGRYTAAPFTRTVTRALCGKYHPNKSKRDTAWNSIAFTNYIQTPVPYPRKRPTAKQWNAAPGDFLRLLETWTHHEPQPTRIIVIGASSWSNMPDTAIKISEMVQAYLIRSSVVMCWALKHTRAGLSWKELANILHFALPSGLPLPR
jgi:hypothetical protein